MEASDVAACWEGNAETWTRQARAGYDLYRDALNTPVFMANLPNVAGLEGLDIGCGEGANTRKLAQAGARMSAIDIAPQPKPRNRSASPIKSATAWPCPSPMRASTSQPPSCR